jgi:hypothetical protein
VLLWSDGPAAQFKNRFMFAFMKYLWHKYDLDAVHWNFFAPSHGKGAVDGVGGCAKRTVWTAIKSRTVTVNCAEDFCKALADKQLEAIPIENFSQLTWVKEACTRVIAEAKEVKTIYIHQRIIFTVS